MEENSFKKIHKKYLMLENANYRTKTEKFSYHPRTLHSVKFHAFLTHERVAIAMPKSFISPEWEVRNNKSLVRNRKS